MNPFPFSYSTDPYETQPVFDSDCNSVDSGDSVKSQQSPIHPGTTSFSLNSSPHPPSIFVSTVPTDDIGAKMPTFHSNGQNGLHHDKEFKSQNAHTQKKGIKLVDIYQHKKGLISRTNLFEDVACGANIFQISYYVKDQDLMVHLLRSSLSGTKRKGGYLNGGNARKRRRLNSGSGYCNGNGHFEDSDSNGDHIDVRFTVYVAGPSGREDWKREHQCSFGAKPNDSDPIDLNDWPDDPDCADEPNANALKIATFEQLSELMGRDVPSSKDKTMIYLWCNLVVSEQEESFNPIQDTIRRQFKSRRPTVERRKITKFVGLKNEGATCYMNSMLQTLYHIASLRRNVYKIPVGHEAEQKKKKIEQERAKKKEAEQKDQADAMSLCDDEETPNSTTATTIPSLQDEDDDDEDDDDDLTKPVKPVKPPISLELQRLFYQLQTGAESNHRGELELHIRDTTPIPDDVSECSVFTLKSDIEFANVNQSDGKNVENSNNVNQSDDDVDMTPTVTSNTKCRSNGKTDENTNNKTNGNSNTKNTKPTDSSNSPSTELPLHWRSLTDTAVSTEKLIKSFGWSGADSFVQHDVQEFLRVLMDKIESKVKGTPAEKIVDKLFVGEYQSYVTCTKVDFESVRTENFQDIQLTIPKMQKRNNLMGNGLNSRKRGRFGNWHRNNGYSSSSSNMMNNEEIPDIYDCLRKFIETERLDGDNQYYANDELKKQDADKGLRFTRFPPVLFLQLCRFEMDHLHNTNKIHDAVRFYEDIDLNPFIYVESAKKKKGDDANGTEKVKEEGKEESDELKPNQRKVRGRSERSSRKNGVKSNGRTTANGSNGVNGENKENVEQSEVIGSSDDEDSDCDPIEHAQDRENPYYNHAPRDDSGGNFGYQLFSVLVHSGSTHGGHYFAYINPSGDRWYKFDDETVCVVTPKEATEEQFGGPRQSAYMLVYIQKKYAQQILKEVNEGDIPNELRKYFRAERERAMRQREEEIENRKKCDINYMDGHSIMGQNIECKQEDLGIMEQYNQKINVLDMGLRSLLTHKRVYRDTMYKELLGDWSNETLIPMEHLVVYNFTERKNKTMRTNAQIQVDLKEAFKGDGNWTDDEIKRHLVRTSPTKKRFGSIYDRIGNIMEKKRSFVLLDDRRITTLEGPKAENNARTILVALKYFDILAQRMYFVDWLRIKTTSITFADISKYIESKLIPETMANGGCLQSLYDLNMKMSEFEAKSDGDEQPKYQFYEEEASYLKQYSIDSVLKCNLFNSDDVVSEDFYNGDIFVFQINPFHSYFSTLKPAKIDNLQNIMIDENQQHQRLPLHFRCRKQEFEEKGMFWYCTANKFIQSQAFVTDIEIKIREKTGWKRQWAKALMRQYMSTSDKTVEEIDLQVRKKIVRSSHKWRVDRRTTFGMIRKRLGSYYGIKPEHFEIWLPQRSWKEQWNYGSSGRGKWDKPLSDLTKQRSEWGKLCPLKFEIQTYNVKDFDEMTEYHTKSHSFSRSPSKPKWSSRIKSLALFNLQFYLPSYPTMPSTSRGMTVSYRKDWIAKDFIQSILNQIIENPVFLFSFFGHITEYIRKNEMEDQSVGDIDIIRNLSPNRFVIVDEEGKPQNDYHMDDEYKMPDSYSQIKYTDFRVHFLAKNDPLVLMDLQNEVKTESEHKGDEQMQIDSKPNGKAQTEKNGISSSSYKKTYGLWVHIIRCPVTNSKLMRKIRVVIEEGESFKDVILRDIWPYLVMNKIHSLSPTNSPKGNDKDKESENEQDDLMQSIIESKVKFRIANAGKNNNGLFVQGELLNRPDIGRSLTENMWLLVYLPKQKTEYKSSYDRPLTIED